MSITDQRQRFFIADTPIRGDVVSVEQSLTDIFENSAQQYPEAVQKLLGEMLVAATLVASTIKIAGRLSLQLQSNQEDACVTWAMAECTTGDMSSEVRALAKCADNADWSTISTSNDVLTQINSENIAGKSVLFINIEPEQGQRYQGIIEQVSNNIADCIKHYQMQSAQIPTLLSIASNGSVAGGIMVQQLPTSSQEEADNLDEDLWPRLTSLTNTINADELLNLPAQEILYRLYHEEEVTLPETVKLKFGCTCSYEKCLSALLNLGVQQVQEMYTHEDSIALDCHFCGKAFPISKKDALSLFKLPN